MRVVDFVRTPGKPPAGWNLVVMTADNDLIEQIVANVLAELQPAPTVPVRAPIVTPPTVSTAQTGPAVIELDLPVLTADLLAARVRSGETVRIGHRSILTPSARDWLTARKIAWTRGHRVSGTGTQPGWSRWQILIGTVTPAITSLRPTLSDWKVELLGTAQEIAEQTIRVISTCESGGVLAISSAAETVACLANRNPGVRAAVLASAGDLPGLVAQLNPNVLAVNPLKKSFVEMRNLVLTAGMYAKSSSNLSSATGS